MRLSSKASHSDDPAKWIGKIMYTNYPFIELGDKPHSVIPFRQCLVKSYDNDKYCEIEINGKRLSVKAGYLQFTEN